jgi:Arc/MetJ family transcription regulator
LDRRAQERRRPTKIALDDASHLEARRLGGRRTAKHVVSTALKEYIRRRKQRHLATLFGKIDYAPGYGYKALRRGR